LLHPNIEAGQLGAAAVQRHRQVQGVTGTQAKGWILEQFSSVTKAAPVQRTQFNAALQQSLELLPSSQSCLSAEAVKSLLIKGSRDCENQSRARELLSSGVSRATTTLVSR
jgi:hypothetical protein